MANDIFQIGSIISCKTCYNDTMEGEVLAYDRESNMLVIKNDTKGKLCNVQLLNLTYMTVINVIAEPSGPCPPLPNIDLQKISQRRQRNIEEKRSWVESIGDGVSPRAQAIFNAITKTFSRRDIRWDGQSIVFMEQVLISPPYREEDCRVVKSGGKEAMEHVQRIINKYNLEESQRDTQKSLPSSPASSVSS